MANVCSQCSKDVHRTRWSPGLSKWIGVDCGCLREQALQTTVNPFSDLVLDHVFDERGQKVRVTSIHQLREAEKRYHFSHHVANSMEANFNSPTQQQAYSVRERVEARLRGR